MNIRMRNQRGFSLVEIMVILGIMGIVLAIAAPSFRGSMNRARFDRATSELQSDLRLALSTAKATGRAVMVDFTPNGYRLIDATDTTRVYRARNLDSDIRFNASGNPLVFPWGMVQPANVNVTSSHRDKDFQILPTGRLELSGGTP